MSWGESGAKMVYRVNNKGNGEGGRRTENKREVENPNR